MHTERLAILSHDVCDEVLTLALRSSGVIDLNAVDTLVNLLNVLVDGCRVLSLTDHLEQILVGEEVETREVDTLGGEKIVKFLLNNLELEVEAIKDVDEVASVLNKGPVGVLDPVDAEHLLSEGTINLLEDGVLLRKLLLDMLLTTEDGLEVLPALLDSRQDLKRICDLGNVVFPQVNLIIELLVERRALMLCKLARVLFDEVDNVLSCGDLVALVSGALRVANLDLEVGAWRILPKIFNHIERLLNLELSPCMRRDLFYLLFMLEEV